MQPDQPRGAERGQRHPPAGVQIGGLEGQRLADRPPGDGDGAQQPLRILRLAADPLPEHLVQVELADRLPAVDRLAPLDVLDQLVDEQRIAPRLAGHHVRLRPGDRIVAAQQRQGQLAGLRLGQRLDGQLAVLQPRGAAGDRPPQLRQERAVLGVLRAEAAQEQQDRRLRRAEQVREQDRAVDVAPLEVVDRQDQR